MLSDPTIFVKKHLKSRKKENWKNFLITNMYKKENIEKILMEIGELNTILKNYSNFWKIT